MSEALKGASDEKLRSEYEKDYHTAQERASHIHQQVIDLCNLTEDVGAMAFPVINFTRLRGNGYAKVVAFLLTGIAAAGVRPDTPFHMNNGTPKKYPADDDSYRYMEYNAIGGGMRVIYDADTQSLFLSVHYAKPALLRADGGQPDETTLANIRAAYRLTHALLKKHSEGDIARYLNEPGISDGKWTKRREEMALKARTSPAFVAWLHNKNAKQDKASTLDAYNIAI
ncbi:MAG TPA: hypothetical protein VHV78_02410 [Gemmatimonadaceae bacterium]|nr:hypothetical protein [Gemmatimonadaceae bacterium]